MTKKTLEGRFDEDKQASIWLNMMKGWISNSFWG
jgi:hypothetical protein